MHNQSTPAFVLHTRPYRDTSVIADLFTLEHGRISAIARSARGIQSRFKGLLRPFAPLHIGLSGKRELKFLSQLELSGTLHDFTGTALICGLYLNELLTRVLTDTDAHPNLFQQYCHALEQLASEDAEVQLRYFECDLLKELGYGLHLTHDCNNNAILPEHYYNYFPDQGFVKHEFGSTEYSFLGGHLIALAAKQLVSPDNRRSAKRLMRTALRPLIGDRPLKARELFK